MGKKARGVGKGLLKEVRETAARTGVSLIVIRKFGRREGSCTGYRMEARGKTDFFFNFTIKIHVCRAPLILPSHGEAE